MKTQHYKVIITLFAISFAFGQVKLSVNTIPKKVKVILDGVIVGESGIMFSNYDLPI